MPNYQQGKIYSIRSVSRPDLIYIGSTTQQLSKRMGGHRRKRKYNCSSTIIIDIGDAYIELIQNFPCNSVDELEAQENIHMRAIKCVNKNSAVDDCPHNKQQALCKECGGSQICKHNKFKAQCRDCGGGSQICKHNRKKGLCKDCGGVGFCKHNKFKAQCKDCGGNRICKHNRQKGLCIDCGGVAKCEHNHIKYTCKDCLGNKYSCVDCVMTFSSKIALQRHSNSKKHLKKINPTE